MSDFLIKLSTVDGDLGNFAANAPAGVGVIGTNSFESLTNRQRASITGSLAAGDTLYIVSHGNGDEWGSAHAGASIPAARGIAAVLALIPDGVHVWLCICDSDANAQALASPQRNITATGYNGTPQLTWHNGVPATANNNRVDY